MAAPGTPAATAGIQQGDQLTAIDGKSIAEVGGLVSFRELLKGSVGTTYRLDLIRDGKPLSTPLTLKDLYE